MSTNSAPSGFAALGEAIANNKAMTFGAVTTVALFIASFSVSAHFLGSDESWEKIQKEALTKVLPLTLFGTLALFVTSALYLLQDPHKTMYYLLVLSCLSLGLSYSALVIAAISK
jgi:uncharacterized membrane protein